MTFLLCGGRRANGPAILLVRVALILAATVAGAQSAAAQAELPADEPLPRSPLELLVESRGELALSATQLDELSRIRERLTAANEPLVARMMALRDEWQQERRSARRGGQRPDAARIARVRAEAAGARARIQENNREAMRTVNRLLSPAQRKELRSLLAARRPLSPGRTGRASESGVGDR